LIRHVVEGVWIAGLVGKPYGRGEGRQRKSAETSELPRVVLGNEYLVGRRGHTGKNCTRVARLGDGSRRRCAPARPSGERTVLFASMRNRFGCFEVFDRPSVWNPRTRAWLADLSQGATPRAGAVRVPIGRFEVLRRRIETARHAGPAQRADANAFLFLKHAVGGTGGSPSPVPARKRAGLVTVSVLHFPRARR